MRKLLAILGVITCMTGLCACGKEEAGVDPAMKESLITQCSSVLSAIDLVVAQGEAAVEQNKDNAAIYNGMLSWQSALGDIGQFNGTDGGTVKASDDEFVVDINVLGSDHNAVVEFVVDNSNPSQPVITGIAANVAYSFGENMTKAVLNTVIGMGTVFVVLIFISLIISCFGLIAKVNVKKPKKEETVAAQSAPAEAPVVAQIAQKEELANDAELVAVIAAAVAAYEGSGSADGFVVRSIRKVNKSKWQNA